MGVMGLSPVVVIWKGLIERSGVVCHGSDLSIILDGI